MSTVKTLALAAFTASALAMAAMANVTVENKSKTKTFDLGPEEIKHEAEPGATVSEACPDGRGVRFAGHDRMATDGDALVILPDTMKPMLAQQPTTPAG